MNLRKLRWFSVSSDNTVAHWSFFCAPPQFANPPQAFLPECALSKEEMNYNGTQDITSDGLPCLPWNSQKLVAEDYGTITKTESILQRWNYCRNPTGSSRGNSFVLLHDVLFFFSRGNTLFIIYKIEYAFVY